MEARWKALVFMAYYLNLRAYPELFALLRGRVPDFRGVFLRGVGRNSAGPGVTQGDAIRHITGSFWGGWEVGYPGFIPFPPDTL